MQHKLAVRKINSFGQAGGTCCVKSGGLRALVKFRKVIVRAGSGQQGLILSVERNGRSGYVAVVRNQDEFFRRGQLVQQRLQQGKKVGMDQDDFGSGVVHRIENLLGRKPPVLRVQNRAHHGNREKAFKIAVRVVIEHANGVAEPDTQPGQRAGKPPCPFKKITVGHPELVAVNDFPVRRVNTGAFEDMPDKQLIIVALTRGVRLFAACFHLMAPLMVLWAR